MVACTAYRQAYGICSTVNYPFSCLRIKGNAPDFGLQCIANGIAQEIEYIERFFGTRIAYFEMQVRTTRTSAVAAQGYLFSFFYRYFTFFKANIYAVSFFFVLLCPNIIRYFFRKTVEMSVHTGLTRRMTDVERQSETCGRNIDARNISIANGINGDVNFQLCAIIEPRMKMIVAQFAKVGTERRRYLHRR